MTKNLKSDYIGDLANSLSKNNDKKTYDDLKILLEKNIKGVKYSKNNNRGISRTVTKAYHDWKKIDQNVADKIADSFVGRKGNHPWKERGNS